MKLGKQAYRVKEMKLKDINGKKMNKVGDRIDPNFDKATNVGGQYINIVPFKANQR
jgi:hypothetical protein